LEANPYSGGAPRTPNATVAASPTATTPTTNSASVTTVRFTASPRNGQSLDQQARDQYDCYRFGVTQTGFDPMNGSASAAGKASQADFDRARAACFEGRGYNIR
jgi:hypothetical protein